MGFLKCTHQWDCQRLSYGSISGCLLYFLLVTRIVCPERNGLLINIQVVLTDAQLQHILLFLVTPIFVYK